MLVLTRRQGEAVQIGDTIMVRLPLPATRPLGPDRTQDARYQSPFRLPLPACCGMSFRPIAAMLEPTLIEEEA